MPGTLRRLPRRTLPTTALVLASLLAPAASRADVLGPQFQVNASTTNRGTYPRVVPTPEGGFLVVWNGNDGNRRGVWAKRYDDRGLTTAPDFLVNQSTALDQDYPEVAIGSAGRFAVVWQTYSPSTKSATGYVRTYDSPDVPLSNEQTIEPLPQRAVRPGVVALGPDEFVVLWTAVPTGLRGRRFGSNGAPLAPSFSLEGPPTTLAFAPVGVPTLPGQWVATWTDLSGLDGSSTGVFARRFDASGTALGGIFQVNTYTTGRQFSPGITATPDGGFVVVWSSYGQDGERFGVFGQRFDGIAQPLGGEFQVNTYTEDNQSYPAVAAGDDGSFVVAWQSFFQDGDGGGIFARRFGADGSPRTGEFQVNASTLYSQTWPGVAPLPDGRFVIVWGNFTPFGTDFKIDARFLLPSALPEVPALGRAALAALTVLILIAGVAVLRGRRLP